MAGVVIVALAFTLAADNAATIESFLAYSKEAKKKEIDDLENLVRQARRRHTIGRGEIAPRLKQLRSDDEPYLPHLEPPKRMKVGQFGSVGTPNQLTRPAIREVRIIQILGPREMLVTLSWVLNPDDFPFVRTAQELDQATVCISGVNTSTLSDDTSIDFSNNPCFSKSQCFHVAGNRQCEVTGGGTKTVFELKVFDVEQVKRQQKAKR